MKYGWKEQARIKVSAGAAAKQLMAIYHRNGDQLTPEIAADEAVKKPKSPLGKILVRNVREAAEAHWREQMRYVFRMLVFYPEDPRERAIAERFRVFEVIYMEDGSEDEEDEEDEVVTVHPVFRLHRDIMNNPTERAQVVQTVLGYLQAWRQKWRHLTELKAVFDAVDAALARQMKKTKKK